MSGEMQVGRLALFILILFGIALVSVGVWPFNFWSYFSNFALLLASWFVFVSAESLVDLARSRPDAPLAHFRSHVFSPTFRKRLNESWPILIVSIFFLPTFSTMKSAIPLFTTYSWDQTFIDLDIALHGDDPWRILQQAIGHPIITATLSALYQLWILLIYAGTVYFALYVGDRQLRVRYFATYFAAWAVNGALLAILLASVGPCFLQPFLGNNHYVDQMNYLFAANTSYPVMSLDVQQRLIDWHASGSTDLGRGISAMPSMHVSLAFLFFLATRKVSRKLGFVFFAYFVAIAVGSVHLAYHYAVDAYLAFAVTAVIWILCGAFGRLSRSVSDRPQSQPAAARL
ncbi:MAG: hypothetical protein CVT78_13820 [Alphaproteobacteria bacterium HGW-Alphaproteobacteria-17]|nr:MAG: hypothetical protein CVT78_13820 [Alphaproteobacteria bacterium HGW-Alphaproteobacteria-17]